MLFNSPTFVLFLGIVLAIYYGFSLRAFIQSLENSKFSSIIYETLADCGLDSSVFVDYGHFKLNSAMKFTKILYNKLHTAAVIDLIKTDIKTDKYSNDENIARLQEYFKYQPANVFYRYALGMLYGKNGQRDKSQREFRIALKIEPGSSKILYASAVVYANKRQYDEAILVFKRLVETQPEKNIFYHNISCLHAIQNKKPNPLTGCKKQLLMATATGSI